MTEEDFGANLSGEYSGVGVYRGGNDCGERTNSVVGQLRQDVYEACEASSERRRIFRKAVIRNGGRRINPWRLDSVANHLS